MKEIRIYKTETGQEPFTIWLHKLRDLVTISRIRRRIDRLSLGNEGDFKSVGEGVFELRMTFGPGYRIYYGKKGQEYGRVASWISRDENEAKVLEKAQHMLYM